MTLPTTLTAALGVIGVMAQLLNQADHVLSTLEGDSIEETEQLDTLRDAILAATAPLMGRTETLALIRQLKPAPPEEAARPLVQVAVQALNQVKAWRDSDGNEPFPHDTRLLIEAVLTAWEVRSREDAQHVQVAPEPMAQVIAHPGWRDEYVPLLVPLPGLKQLPQGTRLYAHLPEQPRQPIDAAQIQRAFMAAKTDTTNGPNNWVEGIRFAERFHGIGGPAIAPEEAPAFDFVEHLYRQIAFSSRTFGPGERTKGVCDHIRKELTEIEDSPFDLEEWVDVIILAFEGAWRTGANPQQIAAQIVAKQTKNEGRQWPDWRTQDPNKAIEHDRSKE